MGGLRVLSGLKFLGRKQEGKVEQWESNLAVWP